MARANQIKNPFYEDEGSWFEESVLRNHSDIKLLAGLSLTNFKNNHLHQTGIITNLTKKYMKLTHFIATHAILAAAIIIISLTTVSGFAMEAFGPENLKPSTLLGLNGDKDKDKKETTKEIEARPLLADENHDVIVIEECDLAVKFKKGSLDLGVKSDILNNNPDTLTGSISFKSSAGQGYQFECFLNKNQQLPDTDKWNANNSNVFNRTTVEHLKQFNFTEASLEHVAKIFDSTCCSIIGASFDLKNGDYVYKVNVDNQGEAMQYITDIQINSLAPSTTSINLIETLEPQTTATPLVADAEYDVVVIPECDLAVRYPKTFNGYNVSAKPRVDQQAVYDGFIYYVGIVPEGQDDNPAIPIRSYRASCYNLSSLETVKSQVLFPESGATKTQLGTTKEEVCQNARLNEASCDLVGDFHKVQSDSLGYTSFNYIFTYNNKVFEITSNRPEDNELDITAQFDSLAPSTPSVGLDGQSQNTAQPSQPQLQSYTNQYMPNLNIRYDNSWSFSTSTEASQNYQGILNREILLKKNGATLKFFLYPQIDSDSCQYPYQNQNLDYAVLNDRSSRVNTDMGAVYASTNNIEFYDDGVGGCYWLTANKVSSSIDSNTINAINSAGTYKDNGGGDTVLFFMGISLDTRDPGLIAEADQIIRQSSW